MESQTVFQISLIAAYIAGIIALFAPCCISYLFPAYLGSVFKERSRVLFMTFVFSLGIFTIMLPIVLGAKALQTLFFDLHNGTYIIGGIFMLMVAVISFLGIKLPMPRFGYSRNGEKNDVVSTFTLGIFSGIASACCAPVLIGVLALSSLTPTMFQSVGVGAAYVLGMVTPLYLASLFIHKGNFLQKPLLKKKITEVKLVSRIYPIFLSNIIAALIFSITGILMIWLTFTGSLGMSVAEASITKSINNVAFTLSDALGGVPYLNLIFVIVAILLMYKFIRLIFKKEDGQAYDKYICPMHSNIIEDKPGNCPECGMNLKGVRGQKSKVESEEQGDHGSMDHMDHHRMMAEDFKRRFFVVLPLTIIVLLLSSQIQEWFRFSLDFRFREIVLFILGSVIVFYGGKPFFVAAKNELKSKNWGMMTLVSLALIAGYIFSAAATFIFSGESLWWEISTLALVFLFGHWIEMRAVIGTGGALKELSKLIPTTAHKIKNGKTIDVLTSTLVKGDHVLIKPGEKIPVDGKVLDGESSINESMITGESRLVEKKFGDEVIGGTINSDGSLTVEITKTGLESTLSQIMELIREAQDTKPSVQKLADRAANYLTVIAIVVGSGTFIFWMFISPIGAVAAATFAITVVVITCPHALGLAIPTVTTLSMSLAAKNGILIKDMKGLEVIRKLDYIVLDKTGTLTKGEFGVSKIIKSANLSENEILKIAASVEAHSEHSIAKGIVSEAKNRKIDFAAVSKFKSIPGKGAEGDLGGGRVIIGNEEMLKKEDIKIPHKSKVEEVGTVVYVASRGKLEGVIILDDEVREESKKAIETFHKMGIKIAMLTGDKREVAENVGKKLGIDTVFSEVLPEDKVSKIKELQSKGFILGMVGDGINDAPSLTQANVGIAIGAGTQVAIESAQIVLIKNNLLDILKIFKLSNHTNSKIKQNLIWATGYNTVAIPLAAGALASFGVILRPEWGAVLMSASSIIVVANSMRLKRLTL